MNILTYNILFGIDKINYLDQLFEKLDCSSKIIQNKIFDNCNFKNCNFDNASLLTCKFVDCEFTKCTLNTIILTNTMFLGKISFENSKLMGINWASGSWPNVKLYSPINFYSCDISHSSFFGLALSGINIQGCKVHDVDFREADLSSGNLTDSDLYQSLFVHTKLVSVDFSQSINYNIDVVLNDVKDATFTFPDVINLLQHLGIKINGLSDKG
ncbi:MAG: hypothetical protein ACD_26C00165G0002 [uncultured bacterium]|nr:MAG: hypothetical protein ACD_26C00165G0002 [uncultured bacterium]